MRPRRLAELKALLAQPDFKAWWSQLTRLRQDLEVAFKQHEELVSQTHLMEYRAEMTQKKAIDTLYRAGEFEDSATGLLAQATDLENRSFRTVAEFEEQRFRVSELWYRLGPLEKSLDELREGKATPSAISQAEGLLKSTTSEYDKQCAIKTKLWETVEKLWEQSSEVSLLAAEQRMQGKKVRREAELKFAEAEEQKQRATVLRQEAEKALRNLRDRELELKALREKARGQFDCTAGTDFIYFRMKEQTQMAWGVPLLEDAETFNIEVKPLTVYVVHRRKVESWESETTSGGNKSARHHDALFIEPARDETLSLEDGDRRFEHYFLTGRKGAKAGTGQLE